MSTQTFKIRKVGGNFLAFDTIDKKRSYGRINIKTGKFVGDTRCMIALHEYHDINKTVDADAKQVLIDKVIDQIREDIKIGDIESLNELLKTIPIENLTAYLPQ